MTRGRGATYAAIVLLLGAAAWRIWQSRHGDAASPAAGRLTIAWKGKDTGSAKLPIELNWCPIDRTARLWAVSNDTGVLVVFYEADTLQLVPHRVIPPGIPVPPHQSATVVMRWAGDSTLAGFNAQSGTIELKGTSSKSVSGSFTVSMRRAIANDTFSLTGSFSGIPVVTKTAGCP